MENKSETEESESEDDTSVSDETATRTILGDRTNTQSQTVNDAHVSDEIPPADIGNNSSVSRNTPVRRKRHSGTFVKTDQSPKAVKSIKSPFRKPDTEHSIIAVSNVLNNSHTSSVFNPPGASTPVPSRLSEVIFLFFLSALVYHILIQNKTAADVSLHTPPELSNVTDQQSEPESRRKPLKKRRSSIRFSAKEDVKEIPHREDSANRTVTDEEEPAPAPPESTTRNSRSRSKSSSKRRSAELENDQDQLPDPESPIATEKSTEKSLSKSTDKTLTRRGRPKKFTPSDTLLVRVSERKARAEAKAQQSADLTEKDRWRNAAILPDDNSDGLRRSKRVRFRPGYNRFFTPCLMESEIKKGDFGFKTEANLGEFVPRPNHGKPVKSYLNKGIAGRKPKGRSGKKAADELNDSLNLFGHEEDFDDYRLDQANTGALIRVDGGGEEMVSVYQASNFEPFLDYLTRKPVNHRIGLLASQVAVRIIFSHDNVINGELIFAPGSTKRK